MEELVEKRTWVSIFLFVLILTNLPLETKAENQQSVQIGAKGDDASRGAFGVRAEIRTHVYEADPVTLDYFWVGVVLEGGAFAQFGYALEPGYYCLEGESVNGTIACQGASALIFDTDARWEWQYWQNAFAKDFYYEIGPASSAGTNGTWHQYSIMQDSNGSAVFVMDGERVAETGFKLRASDEPPTVVAEKVTTSSELGTLGPVEFRNLEYLRENGWHGVDSLISLNGCGMGTSCSGVNTYGVSLEGPNHVIAGSGCQIMRSGELLWTSGYVTLNITVHRDVQFHVTTITGDQEFTTSAIVKIPKGLFAQVTLTRTDTIADGLPGLIGASDQFQSWTGYENSENQSVRLLMDQNKTLRAIWHTDCEGSTRNIAIIVAFVFAIFALWTFYLRKRFAGTQNPQSRKLIGSN
jgi:hypothetical protein